MSNVIIIGGGAAGMFVDIFDGLIQAFVFVFLTALYIGEAVEMD